MFVTHASAKSFADVQRLTLHGPVPDLSGGGSTNGTQNRRLSCDSTAILNEQSHRRGKQEAAHKPPRTQKSPTSQSLWDFLDSNHFQPE